MAKRSRWQGTPKELATALNGVVAPLGRSWLKYSEEEVTAKAKTDPPAIMKALPVLVALQALHAQLSFKRSDVAAACGLLLEMNGEDTKWKVDPASKADYIETMARRVMNICRATTQGAVKGAKWAQQLPWLPAEAPEAKHETEAVEGGEEQDDCAQESDEEEEEAEACDDDETEEEEEGMLPEADKQNFVYGWDDLMG
eukprot:50981-Alexandrium_andersonii.AAC.1